MPDTETLTEEQVAEIEARLRQWDRGEVSKQTFPVSWAEADALCRSLRAAWAKIERLDCVGLQNAQLLDTIRAWSKCEDGYPLDEHINNIATQNAALRTQNQTQAESITYFQEQLKEAHANVESLSQIIFRSEHATAMRNACVEKVKAHSYYHDSRCSCVTSTHGPCNCGAKARFDKLVLLLQSITLDQVQEER